MSDKPITLQGLLDMLRQLAAIPNIAVPNFFRQQPETLTAMMDHYDLAGRLQGHASGDRSSTSFPSDYGSTESGLLVPESSQWNFDSSYYAARQWSGLYGFDGVAVPSAETEAHRKRIEEEKRREEMEKKQRCDAFAQQVKSLSTKPAASIQNPSPQSTMPDYMETLTGWRVWKVSHGKLESLGVNEWWTPRHAVPARCIHSSFIFSSVHPGEPAPHDKCTCGYWSFKSQNELMDVAGNYGDLAVIGTVEIWGRVIECENGYRSEFAYPKELWLLKSGLEYLSWTYGVPVRKMDNL